VVLVIGASGDLAKKKTYPSLFELWKSKLLPPNTRIAGFARTKKSHAELREHLKPALVGISDGDEVAVNEFLSLCYYNSGSSYGDRGALLNVLQESHGSLHNLLVYLAIPPNVFGTSTEALKGVLEILNPQVTGFVRIVLEKPFGSDTDSCNELLQTLKDQNWEERSLFRIDHYLGKEMVQNILTLREHNPWVHTLLNRDMVQSVHLIFKEDIGTEGRGGYFDEYGIVRDVLQNHLLQVLSLLAMDMPEKLDGESIRDAKVDVLKSMLPIVLEDCLFGQYVGYKDDPTIENRDTITPTYACMRSWVNTENWKGVPFILEAGKALDGRVCEARFHLRGSKSNYFVLRLQPIPAFFLTANLKTPGFSNEPVSTHVGVDYGQAEKPGAYTRLLLDVLRGNQASFVRDDELLAAWNIFTPVLQQAERENRPPVSYDEDSDGPSQREEFLKAMGVTEAWLPLPSAL
jgi:glucose-6-phosphate 1-dehydrogenase